MDIWKHNNRLLKFLENKNHLIDRLNLTDDQKSQLKVFFAKYPSHENKINWNRKDLKWEDFTELLDNEGKSKSQAKKYGLSGLKEGEDYKIVLQDERFTIYYPLTFLASETLANPRVAPIGVTGKWCIAGGNYGEGIHDKYWASYTNKRIDFFFVFTKDSKYAIARYPELAADSEVKFECFNSEDTLIDMYDIPGFNFGTELELIKYPHELLGSEYRRVNGFIIRDLGNLGAFLVSYEGSASEIKIPEGVTLIGKSTFARDDDIKKVFIPKSVKEIEGYSFLLCENLTEVVFEEGSELQRIPAGCFSGCHRLEKIKLPSSLVGIGYEAFKNCESLQVLHLPYSAYAIDDSAFAGSGLMAISLSPKTMWLPGKCFWCCPNLINYEIPNDVEVIGKQAFARCSNLSWVVLPKALKKIQFGSFEGCKNLTKISYPGTLKELFNNVEGCTELMLPNITIECSDKKMIIDEHRDFEIEVV